MRLKSRRTWALFPKSETQAKARRADRIILAAPRPSGRRRLPQQGNQWLAAAMAGSAALTTKG